MLNEKKIKIMTKAAIYEQGKGKEDLKMNAYSGSDYVRFNMLKTFLGVTVSVIFVFGLAVLYRMEEVMANMMKLDLWKVGRQLLVAYIIVIAVYAIISFIVYQQRFSKAKKRLKKYNANLDMIARMAEEKSSDRV